MYPGMFSLTSQPTTGWAALEEMRGFMGKKPSLLSL